MWWFLFKGDRLAITGGVVGSVFLLTVTFIHPDIIAVGPSSSMPTVFSGLIAGLLTLITVTLSKKLDEATSERVEQIRDARAGD